MTEKAERGQFQSSPPFGYKMKDGQLEIVEDEANIIKLIFEKFTSKEMNTLQIVKYINSLGVKTHRGSAFENRTIDYILTNPVYIGYVRWTPTGKIKRGHATEDTIIKKSTHIPIIDENIYDKAQKLIAENKIIYKKYHKPTTKNLHWLTGLIKCKLCGSSILRNTKDFYQCNGYVRGKCTKSQLVKIGIIEKAILQQIKDDFSSNININVKFDISKSNTEEVNIISSQLEKIKDKERRMKEAYINGIDSLEEYKENKAIIKNQKDLLLKELQKLKTSSIITKKEETIKEQLKTVYNILNDDTIDMKRKYEVSHMIIDRIDFLRDEGVLELTYKL